MKTNSNKPFWRYVKSQKSESIGVAPLKENGHIFSEPLKKAKILARQFSSVFTVDDQHARDTYPHGPSIPPMPDIQFSEAGVAKLLKKLDPKKSLCKTAKGCKPINSGIYPRQQAGMR